MTLLERVYQKRVNEAIQRVQQAKAKSEAALRMARNKGQVCAEIIFKTCPEGMNDKKCGRANGADGLAACVRCWLEEYNE